MPTYAKRQAILLLFEDGRLSLFVSGYFECAGPAPRRRWVEQAQAGRIGLNRPGVFAANRAGEIPPNAQFPFLSGRGFGHFRIRAGCPYRTGAAQALQSGADAVIISVQYLPVAA